MELVALCDSWEERLETVGAQLGVATYTEFERFLEHDMDAVVLANYFHEHAPFAVAALESGRHVMSETAACHTLGEGVALARAVEKSGCIYMFAENYPYMVFNQEMRRLYQKGAIGEFKYGEGEYIHPDPPEAKVGRSPGKDHWRNWIPATYYCTHAIAPVMFITDTRPVKVNGFVVPYDYDDPTMTLHMTRSDTASVIILRMDNGAVVKALQVSLRGHGVYVRIHGNKGLMENCRHGDQSRLRVWKDRFEKRKGEPTETVYKPDFPSHHDRATNAGHGGRLLYEPRICAVDPYRRTAVSGRLSRDRDEYRRRSRLEIRPQRLRSRGDPGFPRRIDSQEIREGQLVTRSGPRRKRATTVQYPRRYRTDRGSASARKKVWAAGGYHGE